MLKFLTFALQFEPKWNSFLWEKRLKEENLDIFWIDKSNKQIYSYENR